jgi:hypothetical protein
MKYPDLELIPLVTTLENYSGKGGSGYTIGNGDCFIFGDGRGIFGSSVFTGYGNYPTMLIEDDV